MNMDTQRILFWHVWPFALTVTAHQRPAVILSTMFNWGELQRHLTMQIQIPRYGVYVGICFHWPDWL